MKRLMFIILLGLLFSGSIAGNAAATHAAGSNPEAPDTLLQERSGQIMTELQKGGGAIRQDLDKLYELVDHYIAPLIDFEAMSKLTLGKHWKRASDGQRKAFMEAYRNLLRNTYTKSLKLYANQSIVFFPERTRLKEKYATVYSEFVPGNGKPNVPVIYKLRKKENQWLAYNLEIEGLSLVKNYRTSFDREIGDTNLDALITRLQNVPEHATE